MSDGPRPVDLHMASAYASKSTAYFAGVRQDFLTKLSHHGGGVVLEIGCGSGETGAAAMAAGLSDRYVGVELFPDAAAVARTRLSEVLEGDVERITLPWPDATFDAVLMSEVLEHLIDPWAVVARIVPMLRPGALVMASSPNVAQFSIVKSLIAGRWDLADSGPMDRTHLRWFTPSTYGAMFETAGIRVDSMEPLSPPGPNGRLFNILTLNRWKHLTFRQISLIGFKPKK